MGRPDRIALGKAGEDLACRELCRRGYAILARRFRTRFGELDIVARDGETLAFVEVKARASLAFGRPVEAVTARKQAKVVLMASEFRLRCGMTARACRFDVVGVTMEDGKKPVIEVIRGAFDATGYLR